MKDSISSYEQELYINGQRIDAVESVSANYSIPKQHINVIGFSRFKTFAGGPPSSGFVVDKYLVPGDVFLGLINESGIDGYIKRGTRGEIFEDAYLTSLSVSSSVGSIPKLSASFDVYGDMGNGVGTTEPPVTSLPLVATRPKDITIICGGSTTNRVESFSYSVSCQRIPMYKAIDRAPSEVLLIKPRPVSFQFTIGSDDYESENLFDYSLASTSGPVSIVITGVATFSVSNAELISESFSGSAQDEHSIVLSYSGWV